MRTILRPAPLLLLLIGLALILASLTTVYGGRTSGIVVGPPNCSAGFEWRGTPGPFASCTGHDPDAAPGHPAAAPAADTGDTTAVPPQCARAAAALPLCLTVANRPAYSWTNPGGSVTTAPDGQTDLSDLDEIPGTPAWTLALRALDAQWREHH